MDTVTRHEWHGNWLIFFLLCIFGITIPFAILYFITNLLTIRTEVTDSEKLSEYLETRG